MKTLALARRNLLEVARDPLSAALGAVLPLALLAVFLVIGRRTGFPVFAAERLVPALAAFGLSFLLMFSAMLVARDRRSGMLDRISASPLGDAGILGGYALAFLPLAAVQVLACLIIGAIFGYRGTAAGLLGACLGCLLVAVFYIALGLLLGACCTENQIAGIGSLALNLAGILGGAWMDIDAIGGALAVVARILPFRNATDVSVALFRGDFRILATEAAVILFAWTAVAVAAAVITTRRVARRL